MSSEESARSEPESGAENPVADFPAHGEEATIDLTASAGTSLPEGATTFDDLEIVLTGAVHETRWMLTGSEVHLNGQFLVDLRDVVRVHALPVAGVYAVLHTKEGPIPRMHSSAGLLKRPEDIQREQLFFRNLVSRYAHFNPAGSVDESMPKGSPLAILISHSFSIFYFLNQPEPFELPLALIWPLLAFGILVNLRQLLSPAADEIPIDAYAERLLAGGAPKRRRLRAWQPLLLAFTVFVVALIVYTQFG